MCVCTCASVTDSLPTPGTELSPMSSLPNGKPEGEHKTRRNHKTPSLHKQSSSSQSPSPLEIETPPTTVDEHRLTWYTHRCLPEGVCGSTLRAHDLGGRLYLCSGETEDGLPNKGLFYCHIEDITRWRRATPDLPQYLCASAIVQNELVIIGGLSAVDGKCTGAIQSYDSRAQVWVERFPPMPTPRSSAAVFVYAEYVVVSGGLDDSSAPLSVVEVLHIPSQTWETSARLPTRVAGHSMVLCGDQVFVVGGGDGTGHFRSIFVASVQKILSSCTRFALLSNLTSSAHSSGWNQVQDCPFIKMTAVCKNGQLLAFGGEQVTKSASALPAEVIWVYNPEGNSWKPIQGMPSPRKQCCVTILPDDSVIVIGGEPDYNRIDLAQVM